MDIIITNNEVNLCESCQEQYPVCSAEVFFGTGLGMDNICCCNKYNPIEKNRWAEVKRWPINIK